MNLIDAHSQPFDSITREIKLAAINLLILTVTCMRLATGILVTLGFNARLTRYC